MPAKTGKTIFVLGGARSGKSSFALKNASLISGEKAYIATAQAFDAEMEERIRKHKEQRGEDWTTFEEPLMLAEIVGEISDKYSVIVVDCLTLWLSNLMQRKAEVEVQVNAFASALSTQRSATVFVVSNDVGMGIVPENELARRFRDFAGILNQKIAELADEVYLVTAGIPLKIK